MEKQLLNNNILNLLQIQENPLKFNMISINLL